MKFPVTFTHTVGLKTFSESGSDAHGKPIPAWSEAVTFTVMGWSTPHSKEPKLAGHNRVVTDIQLYTFGDFVAGDRDRVEIPGKGVFEVIGDAEDYRNGPWWKHDMLVYNLRQVRG